MRKLLLLSAIIMTSACGAWAQDDMYFTPTKQSKEAAKEMYEKAMEPYYCGTDRDVDEYNRRTGHGVPSSYITELDDSTSSAHHEDYQYSRRLERFDGGRPVVLNVYVNDPWYYDPWYDPWFHDSWYYTWYGPRWYVGGWGWYGPRYYGPWYYGSWYGPRYYRSVYVPTRHHYRSIDRGRYTTRTQRSGNFGRNSSSRSNGFGRSTYSGSNSGSRSSFGGHSGGSFGGGSFGGGSRSSFGGHSGGSFGGHGGGGARGGRR